jgi:hypothetical protein
VPPPHRGATPRRQGETRAARATRTARRSHP